MKRKILSIILTAALILSAGYILIFNSEDKTKIVINEKPSVDRAEQNIANPKKMPLAIELTKGEEDIKKGDVTLEKGDVTLDGKVNGLDLLAINLHILEIPEFIITDPDSFWAADLNNDGIINVIDHINLFSFSWGIPVPDYITLHNEQMELSLETVFVGNKIELFISKDDEYSVLGIDLLHIDYDPLKVSLPSEKVSLPLHSYFCGFVIDSVKDDNIQFFDFSMKDIWNVLSKKNDSKLFNRLKMYLNNGVEDNAIINKKGHFLKITFDIIDETAKSFEFKFSTKTDAIAVLDDSTYLPIKIMNDTVIAIPTQKGDVNSDGKVNGIDLLLLKQHILESKGKTLESGTQPFWAADMNDDGAINGMDLLLLKKKILS